MTFQEWQKHYGDVIALIANGVFIWRKSLIPIAIAHVGMVILLPII